MPKASYATSRLQQQLRNLKLKHRAEANIILNVTLGLNPCIKFLTTGNTVTAKLVTVSDASHGVHGPEYGQSGGILGILIGNGKADGYLYYAFTWSICKQRRIYHSSFGAEIISAADNDDMDFCIKEALNYMYPYNTSKHELVL